MKKTNENLVILITLFAISIVIANVTGARTITTGLHIGPIELALSGGAITYPHGCGHWFVTWHRAGGYTCPMIQS